MRLEIEMRLLKAGALLYALDQMLPMASENKEAQNSSEALLESVRATIDEALSSLNKMVGQH